MIQLWRVAIAPVPDAFVRAVVRPALHTATLRRATVKYTAPTVRYFFVEHINYCNGRLSLILPGGRR